MNRKLLTCVLVHVVECEAVLWRGAINNCGITSRLSSGLFLSVPLI